MGSVTVTEEGKGEPNPSFAAGRGVSWQQPCWETAWKTDLLNLSTQLPNPNLCTRTQQGCLCVCANGRPRVRLCVCPPKVIHKISIADASIIAQSWESPDARHHEWGQDGVLTRWNGIQQPLPEGRLGATRVPEPLSGDWRDQSNFPNISQMPFAVLLSSRECLEENSRSSVT